MRFRLEVIVVLGAPAGVVSTFITHHHHLHNSPGTSGACSTTTQLQVANFFNAIRGNNNQRRRRRNNNDDDEFYYYDGNVREPTTRRYRGEPGLGGTSSPYYGATPFGYSSMPLMLDDDNNSNPEDAGFVDPSYGSASTSMLGNRNRNAPSIPAPPTQFTAQSRPASSNTGSAGMAYAPNLDTDYMQYEEEPETYDPNTVSYRRAASASSRGEYETSAELIERGSRSKSESLASQRRRQNQAYSDSNRQQARGSYASSSDRAGSSNSQPMSSGSTSTSSTTRVPGPYNPQANRNTASVYPRSSDGNDNSRDSYYDENEDDFSRGDPVEINGGYAADDYDFGSINGQDYPAPCVDGRWDTTDRTVLSLQQALQKVQTLAQENKRLRRELQISRGVEDDLLREQERLEREVSDLQTQMIQLQNRYRTSEYERQALQERLNMLIQERDETRVSYQQQLSLDNRLYQADKRLRAQRIYVDNDNNNEQQSSNISGNQQQ